MTKTKTPFLSFGAQGTIGDTLTAQKRGSGTLLRRKPTPAYRNTLPQQYQRWLYEDYAYLWTKQAATTQREYAAAGVRFHLTGFQYWMKYQLTNLPDILAWWKLDEKLGAIAHDSSKNANHGTIFGPSPSTGRIDGAFLFDGINDYILVPHSPTINLTTDFTIICFARTKDKTIAQQRIISRNIFADDQNGDYVLRLTNDDVYFYIRFANAYANANFPNIVQNDTWHALAAVKEGTAIRVYVDKQLGPNVGATGTATNTHPLYIGRMNITSEMLDGDTDNTILYNRALDTTEIARWAERRYPS